MWSGPTAGREVTWKIVFAMNLSLDGYVDYTSLGLIGALHWTEHARLAGSVWPPHVRIITIGTTTGEGARTTTSSEPTEVGGVAR